MPSQQELDLERRLADLEKRIAETEAIAQGMYNGGMDRYIHSGYVQWDGIDIRLDDKGIQIQAPTEQGAIFFLPKLETNPTLANSEDYGALTGQVTASSSLISLWARSNAGTIARALLSANSTGRNYFGISSARLVYDSDLTPSQLTGDVNDYSPTNWLQSGILRLSSDASRNITGLEPAVGGEVILVVNIGSNPIVLKDESASSTAAYRFALNGDVTIGADESVLLWYDEVSSRWRVDAAYTPSLVTDHTGDTSDAHDASAISVLDTANNFTGTDVEAVLAELAVAVAGGGGMGVITNPRDWLDSAGYEFWLVAGSGDSVTASGATNLSGLDSYGWTTTALDVAIGNSGDFLSSGDTTPVHIPFNASGDNLSSPTIFGDYSHGLVAAAFLGAMPTTLNVEIRAAWPTASANEDATYIGFPTAAAIYSNGTTFALSNGTATDGGAALDAAWHTFKISINATNTEWFIDGSSQGTLTTRTDLWPRGVTCTASTTNRVNVAWIRVWYE